jgi:hypothetical protein
MKYYITLISFLILNFGYSQETVNYKIKEVLNNSGDIYQLEYYNNNTGNLKTITIEDLSPLKNLPYAQIKKKLGSREYHGYNLENIDKETIANNLLDKYSISDSLLNLVNFKSAIQVNNIEKFKNYRFLQYDLLLLNEKDCFVGSYNYLIVLSPEGEILDKINDKYRFERGVISNNGRYLAYRHISPIDIDCYNVIPTNTTIIYDLKTHQKIFETQSDENKSVNYPTVRDNFDYFVIFYKMQDGKQVNVIYPDLHTIYKKFYKTKDAIRIFSFTENGIIIKDMDGKDKIELFKEKFTKESF